MLKSKTLLVSLVFGTLYLFWLLYYCFSNMAGAESGAETVGVALATVIITPHLILVLLAVIFNALGYFKSKKGFALTGGILYSVAAVIFLLYAPYLIISIVCSFVGYSKIKKNSNLR